MVVRVSDCAVLFHSELVTEAAILVRNNDEVLWWNVHAFEAFVASVAARYTGVTIANEMKFLLIWPRKHHHANVRLPQAHN